MSHQPDSGIDGYEMLIAMFCAIDEDQTERLRSLIEEGADVNTSILSDSLMVTTFKVWRSLLFHVFVSNRSIKPGRGEQET